MGVARHSARRGTAWLLLLGALLVVAAGCAAVQSTADTTDIYEPAPWDDGEHLVYSLTDETGDVVGRGELIATLEDGAFHLEQRFEELNVPEGQTPTTDRTLVIVDSDTFRPLEGWRDIVRRDDGGAVTEERYEWEYVDLDGERHLISRHIVDGEISEDDFEVREHHYDNESALWLWRAAALEEEFEEHYVSVNAIDGSQPAVRLHVPQTETIEAPAGEYEVWRVLLRTGRATFTAWINSEPPHEIVRWDNNELVFELEGPAE